MGLWILSIPLLPQLDGPTSCEALWAVQGTDTWVHFPLERPLIKYGMSVKKAIFIHA